MAELHGPGARMTTSPRPGGKFRQPAAPIRSSVPPCSGLSRPSPAGGREDAASLDRPCARQLRDLAVGAEECSRRGSNKRMEPYLHNLQRDRRSLQRPTLVAKFGIYPGRHSHGSRVGLHIDLFEACSAFTRVAACTLALSPIRDTLIEGFSHFVTSMTAPIASGWSGCRVGLAPTGKRRLSTAHVKSSHSATPRIF